MLDSMINVSAICRMLRENGWEAEAVPLDEMSPYFEDVQAGMPSLSDTPAPAIKLRRGGFNLEIPMPIVLRVGLDFMSPMMIVAMAEHSYRTSVVGEAAWRDTFFTGEKLVWV